MSTDETGKQLMDEALREAQALVADADREEEQFSFLDPLSPEEMAEAAEEAGPNAGPRAITKIAREKRKAGRPKGAPNRRNEDFRNFLLAHGRHPALTMMEIQTTQPETLMEMSRQFDVDKRRMTYGEAQGLRVRCAEALLPYIESKKPVAVELDAKGDFILAVPGVNLNPDDEGRALSGETFELGDWTDVDPDQGGTDRNEEAPDPGEDPTP